MSCALANRGFGRRIAIGLGISGKLDICLQALKDVDRNGLFSLNWDNFEGHVGFPCNGLEKAWLICIPATNLSQ
jgi:hypothetical protein